MSPSLLFSPMALRSVHLKNRVMVAPMWQYRGERGFATDWHLVHLGRFALGGAGLVMTEGISVTRNNFGTVGDLGIHDDAFVEPLRRVAAFITSCGSVPGIQLMHAGRKARLKFPWDGRGPLERTDDIPDWEHWEVVGATAEPHAPGYPVPRALTQGDLVDLVDAWGAAARRADAAGFEVLEIHAGHGYLLHEFLSATSNTRADRYGGSFENRTRLLREVIAAVRENWPDSKPVFVRISAIDGVGWSLADSVDLALALKVLGVDAIDCSSGGMGVLAGSPLEPGPGIRLEPGYQVALSAAVRSAAVIPTVAVGLIVNAHQAEGILQAGQADIIAVGREVLFSPNWPLLAAEELDQDGVFAAAPANHAYYLSGREKSLRTTGTPMRTRSVGT